MKCSKDKAMKNRNLFFLKDNLWIVINLIDWMELNGMLGLTDIAKYVRLSRAHLASSEAKVKMKKM